MGRDGEFEKPALRRAAHISSLIAESRRLRLAFAFAPVISRLSHELLDLESKKRHRLRPFIVFLIPKISKERGDRIRAIELTLQDIADFIAHISHIPGTEWIDVAKIKPSEKVLAELSLKEKGEVAHVIDREGRDTTLYSLGPTLKGSPQITVVSRDVGGSKALTPVIRYLQTHDASHVNVVAFTDGQGRKEFETSFDSSDRKEMSTPSEILHESAIIEGSKVLVIDPASQVNLDMYLRALHGGVKTILLLDAHTSSLRFLDAIASWNMPFPDAICAIDSAQYDIIVEKYPELGSRIHITGQPIYDKYAPPTFNREAKRREVREQMASANPDFKIDDILVSVTLVKLEKGYSTVKEHLTGIADALSRLPLEKKERIVFALRKHPGDTSGTLEEYTALFAERGLRTVTSQLIESDDIVAASDVSITTLSTLGQVSVQLGIPTFFVVDKTLPLAPDVVTDVPSAKMGASVLLDNPSDLTDTLDDVLFNPDSSLKSSLKRNCEEHYKNDGGNSKRVAEVIRSYIDENRP